MADDVKTDDYQKKFQELQKYVPFLENTIRRLKAETGKSREAQISKLQSLLAILTNTKRKLKFEALKRCEEVILKLYDKVDKQKSTDTLHKFKCRTPPSEMKEFTLSVARQKLNKHVELTPASPSPPPLDVEQNVHSPVVIPTEKIKHNDQSDSHSNPRNDVCNIPTINQNQRQFSEDSWCNNFNDSPQTNYEKNWQRPIFENRLPLKNTSMPMFRPPMNVGPTISRPLMENITIVRHVVPSPQAKLWPLYQRRSDIMRSSKPQKPQNTVWSNPPLQTNKLQPLNNRELVDYAGPFVDNFNTENNVQISRSPNSKATEHFPVKAPLKSPLANHIETMKNNDVSTKMPSSNIKRPPAHRELIKINFTKPVVPENDIKTNLSKPPLSESDLQDLLSSANNSPASEEQSPTTVDESLDLEQLEKLREKLNKELEDTSEKTKEKMKTKKIKTDTKIDNKPATLKPPKSPRIVERVVKESENIFGNLLSSIDEQIMEKTKEKKNDKKDNSKKEDSSKKEKKSDCKDKEKKENKDKDNKQSKLLNVKDISSLNEKVKSNYFKDDNKKDKDSKLKNDSEQSKHKDHAKNKDDSKHNNKSDSKHKESSSKSDHKSITKTKHDSKEENLEHKEKSKTSKDDSKNKERKSASKEKELKSKENIDTSKISLSKSSMSDSVKDNSILEINDKKLKDKTSDESHSIADKHNTKEIIKIPSSGRLSDKYPHKRKSSTETLKSQTDTNMNTNPISDTKPKIPNAEVHPIKLADPRLRSNHNFTSPPQSSPFDRHSFNESFDNHTMQNNFRNDPQPMGVRPNIFPGESCNMNRSSSVEPLFSSSRTSADSFATNTSGNRTLADPFLSGNRTPVDPFLSGNRTPVDPFHSGNRTPADPFLSGNRTPSDQFLSGNQTPTDPFRSGNRTPADPFHSGNRTPADPFLSGNRTPVDLFLSGNRTPVDPFLSGNRTPADPFLSGNRTPVDLFLSGNRTPVDPFLSGNRTPSDQFLSGNRTAADPFLSGNRTPADAFLSGNRTPADPFLSGNRTPADPFATNHFPNNFNNYDPRNSDQIWNRNHPNVSEMHLQQNHFSDRRPNNFQNGPNIASNNFQSGSNIGPNFQDMSNILPNNFQDRSNKFSDRPTDFQNQSKRFQNFSANQLNNPRYPNSNQNMPHGHNVHNQNFKNILRPPDSNKFSQYDLSQMKPIDFYDNTPDKQNSSNNLNEKRIPSLFEIETDIGQKFNRPFPATRGSNKGNFRGARGTNMYNWSASRRASVGVSNEEFQNKKLNNVNPKSQIDPSKTHSRFSIEDKKDDQKQSRSKISYEKTRKSVDENIEKNDAKEISSPLDSLYASEKKKQVGKGYGIQKFKIPKIKRNSVRDDSVEEEKKEVSVTTETSQNKTNTAEVSIKDSSVQITDKEQTVNEISKKDDIITENEKTKDEENATNDENEEVTQKLEATVSANDEYNNEKKMLQEAFMKSVNKSEADQKWDMFNNFMKHMFETCDRTVFLEFIEKFGCSLPQAKTKRICRIIESDSEESDSENKKTEESDKKKLSSNEERTETEDVSKILTKETEQVEEQSVENVVESVGERIKNNRRRKPLIYSSDSSPEKLAVTKLPEQIKAKRPRRKNALELLQDDIREMFISEGVLTATGKRMCRLMNEHQESVLSTTKSEVISSVKKKELNTTDDEDEMPLTKRKSLIKNSKNSIDEISINKALRRTRSSPRVILEKLEIPETTHSSDDESEIDLESTKLTPETKRPQRTRQSHNTEACNTKIECKTAAAAKKKSLPRKGKNNVITDNKRDKTPESDKEYVNDSISDNESVKSEELEVVISKKSLINTRKVVRKRPKRKNWAMGVIRKKKLTRSQKALDKTVSSPSATGTEISDQLSIPEIINDSDVEQAAENDCRTIDVASSDNEENSLLKIDLIPDVNYYLNKKNKYDCKLCDYRGKFIVHHYKNKHPESENMISRLSPDEAEAAKLESETNHFELINAYEEIIRGKKRRTNFSCRFCSLNFKQEFASTFFDHICVHTGEYRYKCEKCNFWTGIRKTLSAHCHTLHPEMRKPITISPIYPCSPNFRLLFGYICCACNFTQLLKINVEKHIKVSHPDQDVKIVKVSMSSKPVPLDDLKEKKKDQETVDGEAVDAEAVDAEEVIAKAVIVEAVDDEAMIAKAVDAKMSIDVEQEIIAHEIVFEEFNTEENESQEKIITEKPKEINAELESPKERERDMTVFMESDDISMREKLIESERLKKMEEVINIISPRRSTLQFIEKLKTKLDSAMESGLNEEFRNEELGIQSIDSNTAQEKEKSKSSDENLDKELKVPSFSIANTWSLADTQATSFYESNNDQNQSESEIDVVGDNDEAVQLSETESVEDHEDIDVSNVELQLPSDSKQKGVLNTIQRLAAKLQNPTTQNIKFSESNLSTSSSSSSSSVFSADNDDKTNEEQIINVGSIKVCITNNDHQYMCMIPDCYYTTLYKISFTKHCSEQHQKTTVSCDICVKDGIITKPFTLTSLFVHLFDKHKNIAKQKKQCKEEQPTIVPGTIRLRRISGDVLSSPKSKSKSDSSNLDNSRPILEPENSAPQEQLIQHQDPPILQPQIEPPPLRLLVKPSSQPSNFLQIVDVRTLTLEEENNLHAKTATVSPPKEPEKIYPQPKITVPLSDKQILIPVPSLSNSFKIIWKENGKASAGATASTSTSASSTASVNTCTSTSTGTSTSNRPKEPTRKKLENDNIINNMRALFSGKHVEIITDMMKYPKLNDLYKCPDSNCAFSTSDAVGFSAHFHSHNFAPVGKYCVYCTTNIEAASATLINHIYRYHSHCLYQCSYCFFRAILPTYIITHQNLLHKPFKLQMHILPPIIYKNKPQTVEPLARNHTILQIECKQDNCKHMYLTIDDFIQHVHVIHNIFKCSMCDLTTLATRTHLAYHNIGLYQCRFCLFGAQEPEEMYKHYALVHYYVRPIAYIRQFKTNSKISLYPKDRLAAIETIDLEAKVDEKSKFPNCQYLVNNSILTKLSKDTVPAAADISKPPLPFEPGEVPQTNPVIQVIDLREDVTTEARASEILPISKDLEEPEVTIKHRTVESREAIVNAVDPLNLDQEMPFEINEPNLNFDQVPSRIQSENDDKKLDENLVDNSDTVVYSSTDDGLNGYELYKCGTPDCFFKASNIKDFKNHMYLCKLLKTYGGWYICIHCDKRFKFVGGLVDHIQIHGPKRFSCSLCNCKAPLNHIIAKHMKNKHKIFNVKIVPIDPQKSDMNLDRFIAMPSKTKKRTKDQQFAATITDLESESSSSNCLRTEEKTIFGPEDIDLLPRPPVYAQEIRCKLCSYNTKVRSNMQRHLQGHMDEKSVPETAPVNPVPCLEKNEKMFDKMTNLAASSHTTGRMGGKYVDKSDKGLTNLEESTYPVFIPVNKRYVCGAKGCNYLTHGDAMFRCHFTALHFDEITYKCPHCQIELSTELEGVSIDNILFHLKMHDLHLYKCNYCDFYHYQRHKTERHVSESHSDRPVTIQTIRELESSANLEDNRPPLSPKTVESVDSQEAKPWHCGFCPYRSVSRSDIQNHAARIHDIKSQYKCGLCHFRCSARNNYNSHFKTKHPNSEIDIISVYYKVVEESSSPLKNVVPEVVSEPEIFDTTPLWSKNKTGVRHIRGILLEEARGPKKSAPKIIEKLSEIKSNSTTSDISKLTDDDKIENTEQPTIKMKFPMIYGIPEKNFYVCPFCEKHKTKSVKEFVSHLHTEMKYYRCACELCDFKSVDIQEAKGHWIQNHAEDGQKEKIKPLPVNGKIEHWIEKCIQQQLIGMKKSENTNSNEINSSTETLVLDLGESENENSSNLTATEDNSNKEEPVNISLVNQDQNSEPENYEKKVNTLTTETKTPPTRALPKIRNHLKCEHCPFIAKTRQTLRKHTNRHFIHKPFECKICKFDCFEQSKMYQHFAAKHPGQTVEYNLIPAPKQPTFRLLKRKRQSSESPDEASPTKLQLIHHNINSELTPPPVLEPQIDDVSQMITEPNIAADKVESEKTDLAINYICFHCPRRSEDLNIIRYHFIENHERIYKGEFRYKKLTLDKNQKFPCKYCDWLGHPDGLKHHMKNHPDKQWVIEKNVQYRCTLCQKIFFKLNQFRKHFSASHPNENLTYQTMLDNSDTCIDTIEIIEEKIMTQSEESKLMHCEYCPDTFEQSDQLLNHHQLLHSHLKLNAPSSNNSSFDVEKKKFKCPQCGHTSNSYAAMRDHLRSHNKPYKCTRCSLSASYPSILKTHHYKEHRNFKFDYDSLPDAQKLNEELRENLLILQADGEYRTKLLSLKRPASQTKDEPPPKKIIYDSTNIVVPSTSSDVQKIKQTNVAKKSTTQPSKIMRHYVAKKSTTPNVLNSNLKKAEEEEEGFTYYGTKPCDINEYKHVMSEINIMGKSMPINVGAMTLVLNLFPIVLVEDFQKKSTT